MTQVIKDSGETISRLETRLEQLRMAPLGASVPLPEKQRLFRNYLRRRKRIFKDFKLRAVWDKDKQAAVINADGRFLMTLTDLNRLVFGDRPETSEIPAGV